MKFIFLSLLLFLEGITLSADAQNIELWGTTTKGGNEGYGNIFSFNPGKDSLSDRFDFDDNGTIPYGNLLLATDGKYYGMTTAGGSVKNTGVIFTYDDTSNQYTVIHSFDSINGAVPYGSLMQAANGLLYGVTSTGGINGLGIIFSLDPSANIFTKLYDFDFAGGGVPMYCTLMQASNGLLYGTTTWGGAGYGTIFSFNTTSNTFKLESILTASNSQFPYGSLIQANDGNLYGMSNSGGLDSAGNIFRFNPITGSDTDVYDFTNDYPTGALIQAKNGLLYAMTPFGGLYDSGTIFSFNISDYSYSDLYDFHSLNGTTPYGNLLQASNGKLYGMTSAYTFNTIDIGDGIIFSFNTATNNYKSIHVFNSLNYTSATGAIPYGSLIQGNNGLLYGMTSTGGTRDVYGTIFNIDTTGTYFNIVHHFVPPLGWNPQGGLSAYGNGKLYGLASMGGENGCGNIYCYNPDSNNLIGLYNFNVTDGAFPLGSFYTSPSGILYATTSLGGILNYGNLISFYPVNNSFKNLFEFGDSTGELSQGFAGYPIQASGDLLYGTSFATGFNNNYGGIYSFNTSDSSYKLVYKPSYNNQESIFGSLLLADNGLIYGVSYSENSHEWGTLFNFDTATNVYNDLYDFYPTTGDHPYGNLIQANNGFLYGLAQGGKNSAGVIFSYNTATNTYNDCYDLDSIHGYSPHGSLLQGSDGKLYGTTYEGGLYGFGVIFSFDPSTLAYTDLFDFNYSNGKNPVGSLVEITATGINQLLVKNNQISIYPNPTSNQLTVVSNAPINQITITNLLGEIIYRSVQTGLSSAKQVVNVSPLPVGLYIISVETGNTIYTDKLIIER